MLVDSKPGHNDSGYDETHFYLIMLRGAPIYRGHTIQDVNVRLSQHWNDAITSSRTDKFHTMLINQNPDDIDIVVTETQTLNHQQEAEDYEMVLLNQDKLNGRKMLNTKSSITRIKRKQPIPLSTNQPKMDLQKYVDIQQVELVIRNDLAQP